MPGGTKRNWIYDVKMSGCLPNLQDLSPWSFPDLSLTFPPIDVQKVDGPDLSNNAKVLHNFVSGNSYFKLKPLFPDFSWFFQIGIFSLIFSDIFHAKWIFLIFPDLADALNVYIYIYKSNRNVKPVFLATYVACILIKIYSDFSWIGKWCANASAIPIGFIQMNKWIDKLNSNGSIIMVMTTYQDYLELLFYVRFHLWINPLGEILIPPNHPYMRMTLYE